MIYSPVAQPVEQVAVNHFVGGSSPSRGAINVKSPSTAGGLFCFRAVSAALKRTGFERLVGIYRGQEGEAVRRYHDGSSEQDAPARGTESSLHRGSYVQDWCRRT